MDQHDFTNGLRSLFNIDGYQLPELNWGQQLDFVQNPVKYFIQADDEQQAAIWREVAKRQRPDVIDTSAADAEAEHEFQMQMHGYRNQP